MFSKLANLQASTPHKTETCRVRDSFACKWDIFENICQWHAQNRFNKVVNTFLNTPPKVSTDFFFSFLILSSNEMQSSIPSVNITSTLLTTIPFQLSISPFFSLFKQQV